MKRRNELTAVAKQQAPEVAKVLAALTARPDCLLARMSGSGATCFGLFESVAVARAAADVLAMTHPDWWVRSGEILSQPPVVQVANVQGPLDTI
jgi:4-diphosphocytidyl-2-C-methyl-D-erythritol kinase